jgi:hypothetical protein
MHVKKQDTVQVSSNEALAVVGEVIAVKGEAPDFGEDSVIHGGSSFQASAIQFNTAHVFAGR